MTFTAKRGLTRQPLSPRGVRLGELELALAPTTLEVSRDGDALLVRDKNLVSRVEVTPPANPEIETAPISAVNAGVKVHHWPA